MSVVVNLHLAAACNAEASCGRSFSSEGHSVTHQTQADSAHPPSVGRAESAVRETSWSLIVTGGALLILANRATDDNS